MLTIKDTSLFILKLTFFLLGNELRQKNKTIQFFTPSLNWLNIKDRIGILRTQDGTIKFFINGEELAVAISTLPEAVYAVFELKGNCAEISVISHKANISPVTSIRLQDSLELVLDPVPVPDVLDGKEIEEHVTNVVKKNVHVYEFHDNHGRNIEISSDKAVARRVASYNQGKLYVLLT